MTWHTVTIQLSMVTHTRNSCSAFTHPKCTHTAVNTHTPWTHTRSSGQQGGGGAVGGSVVLASDVTPTERWLNVWCIWHTFWKHFTSVEVVIWLVELNRNSGDASVAFIFGPPGNKDAVVPNPLMKEESRRVYKCDDEQGQLNAGFSKICEIFKVRGIESLKYIWEFHTPVCYCDDISTPRNVTLNEMNYDWLFDMSVKRPHGRALANESGDLFQTFSRQSEGLATRD